MAAEEVSAGKLQAAFTWARSLQRRASVSEHHYKAAMELWDFIRPYFQDGPCRALEVGAGEPPYLTARILTSIGWDVATLDALSDADIKADVHDIPLPANQFDLVIARHVLEHTLIPYLALAEMRRVSRRYALVVVPSASDKAVDWPDHLYALPQRGWERAFDKVGLRVVRYEEGDHTEQYAIDQGLWRDREFRYLLEKE